MPHNLGKREILWLLAEKGKCIMKYGKLELGQIEALVNIIGGLEAVMQILQGTAKVVVEIGKYIIDCDADPFVPEDWKVESHKKGGSWSGIRQKSNFTTLTTRRTASGSLAMNFARSWRTNRFSTPTFLTTCWLTPN